MELYKATTALIRSTDRIIATISATSSTRLRTACIAGKDPIASFTRGSAIIVGCSVGNLVGEEEGKVVVAVVVVFGKAVSACLDVVGSYVSAVEGRAPLQQGASKQLYL